MRRFYIFLIALFLLPVLLVQAKAGREGGYRDGYVELVTYDTLAATDSVVVYTIEFEGLPADTLKWGIWMLAVETGAQTNNLDIDLIFSPDSSSGFSGYQALKANLDVGGTCDDKWYHFGLGANADELVQMKWVGIIINNADSDANSLIVKSFGIAFTQEE